MGFPGFEPGASSVLSTSSTADCTLALHNLLNIWNAINNNCWRGILGPGTRTSLFTGLSYQQRLPRCLKYCFPHSGSPLGCAGSPFLLCGLEVSQGREPAQW